VSEPVEEPFNALLASVSFKITHRKQSKKSLCGVCSMSSQIIRLKQVLKKTGLSRSCIYNLIAKNDFPTRIQLSERSIGFLESEVDAWIEERAANSRVGGVK
jgi:prophage regulatory protein